MVVSGILTFVWIFVIVTLGGVKKSRSKGWKCLSVYLSECVCMYACLYVYLSISYMICVLCIIAVLDKIYSSHYPYSVDYI